MVFVASSLSTHTATSLVMDMPPVIADGGMFVSPLPSPVTVPLTVRLLLIVALPVTLMFPIKFAAFSSPSETKLISSTAKYRPSSSGDTLRVTRRFEIMGNATIQSNLTVNGTISGAITGGISVTNDVAVWVDGALETNTMIWINGIRTQ